MSHLENAYALLIGVGDDLPVTVHDATAIHNILADEKLAGYKPDNIILLTNDEADREGILNAFDLLISKIDESSSVFLFYSGHGGLYEPWNQFYLVPNKFDPVEYESTWVKAEELKEKIKAINSKKLIFFLDCCHAAGMTKSAPKLGQTKSQTKLENADGLAQKLDDGKGMSILSSCREDQLSYIMDGDNNSLFTKCLIEVLKGKHKANFSDPYVRISEVVQYVFKSVPERNPAQRPYANLQIYDDFALSYVPKNSANVVAESAADQLIDENKSGEVTTVFRKTEEAENVVVFIHGFSGEAANSFGKIPSFLMNDSEMDNWDLYPIGFSEYVNPALGKNIWASVDDIEKIADYLSTSLKYKFGQYKKVAIVSHSLGGLVAQKAILSLSEENKQRISHVFLFATPSNGLASSAFAKLWNKHLKELSEEGSFISNLRNDWNETFSDEYPFFFKSIAATHDEFVSVDSSLKPFNKDDCTTIVGSHFSIIQPKDTNCDCYHLIHDTLTNHELHESIDDEHEENLLLQDYKSVVDTLLPNAGALDKRGLERLIFALEGLQRSAEALELLKTHPLAQNNSDVLGLIGGRYKRSYLLSFIKSEGDKALDYYSRALQIAVDCKDAGQVYYLAINLAFLNLIVLDDKSMMRVYANQTLDACEQDPFNSLWKLASMAEGNLYLGALDKAKEYYSQAANNAGVREKISMYTNAHAAYTCLMQNDNPNDDFEVFLKSTLLN